MNARLLIAAAPLAAPEPSPYAALSVAHLEALWLVAERAATFARELARDIDSRATAEASPALGAALDQLDKAAREARATGEEPWEVPEGPALHRCADASKTLIGQVEAAVREKRTRQRLGWVLRIRASLTELGLALGELGVGDA